MIDYRKHTPPPPPISKYDALPFRNEDIDVLKGLAIVFMIIGHCIPQKTIYGVALRGMIYSFHMPLFFLVGGMFFKGNLNIKRDAHRLLLPYLFTGVILLLAKGIESIILYDSSPFLSEVIKVLSGSTWYKGTNLYLNNMPSVGAIYFLLALFWCRVVYGILNRFCSGEKLLLGISCLVFASLAVLNDNLFIHFPLSINAGLSCLFYFFIGHNFVKKAIEYSITWWMIAIIFVSWLLLVYFFSPMDMGGCLYKNFYASIVCACLGTYLLYLIAGLISKTFLKSLSLRLDYIHFLFYVCIVFKEDFF